MEDDVLWAEKFDKSDTDSEEESDDMYDETVTHEQQQIFSEESDDDEFCGFESILLILGRLILVLTPGGLLVLKPGASYT